MREEGATKKKMRKETKRRGKWGEESGKETGAE